MIMIAGDLVYRCFTEGDKRICSPDYSQTTLLHCSLQRNTLSTSILVTWYWIALQAPLQCIVLQHSSLCTQFCAWSSCSVVRVSFWEWSSHLDWLHSLPLYPTTAQLHYCTVRCTSPLCYSTKQASPGGKCCQNTLVASPGGQIYATEKEWVVPACNVGASVGQFSNRICKA